MIDVKVTGAEDFLRLSRALKDAGETELRKELHKGLRDAANKHKHKAAEALADALPSALAGRGKAVKQAVKVKTGSDPGVSVVVQYGSAGRGLGAANAELVNARGVIRHPVFASKGRRQTWVSQTVKSSGWFDETWQSLAPQLRESLVQVLNDVAAKVAQKAR